MFELPRSRAPVARKSRQVISNELTCHIDGRFCSMCAGGACERMVTCICVFEACAIDDTTCEHASRYNPQVQQRQENWQGWMHTSSMQQNAHLGIEGPALSRKHCETNSHRRSWWRQSGELQKEPCTGQSTVGSIT